MSDNKDNKKKGFFPDFLEDLHRLMKTTFKKKHLKIKVKFLQSQLK